MHPPVEGLFVPGIKFGGYGKDVFFLKVDDKRLKEIFGQDNVIVYQNYNPVLCAPDASITGKTKPLILLVLNQAHLRKIAFDKIYTFICAAVVDYEDFVPAITEFFNRKDRKQAFLKAIDPVIIRHHKAYFIILNRIDLAS